MNSFPWHMAPKRVLALLTVGLAFALACGMQLRYVCEARRQAQMQLSHVLLQEKPNAQGVVAAFDGATNYVIAAAFLPYPIFAFTILVIIRQMFKLKHRYEALQRDLYLS